MTIQDLDLVRGSKGGGKGKGGGSGSNASNTLRSKARARWVEIISEGPCEGLVADGAVLPDDDLGRGVYFEQTPVKNENATENFENVIISQRRGYPDQEHLTGFPQVETSFQVETQVKRNTGPVVRTINEQNADSVRVIMRLPALVKQNSKSGSLETTSVSYAIEVRGYNGVFQRVHTENLVNQKTTSAVQRAHRVELPFGGCPWDIRVVRLTADSESDTLSNDTYFESYTVCVEGKFTYPHTALVAMEVNAEDMGSSVPARYYRYRGLIISVPSNYDPINRTYTGVWNGTFKQAWTNNPAWIFYDLLTNDRYGLGEFVSAQIVDKWSLYQIAQYCDQQVKTGFKDSTTGADLYEPRYTFNGVLNSRDDAWRVLQQISTAWRGMAYWSLGQVFATADMPDDPVKLFSPANVINGEFSYSGTSQKARHSVALVTYNNPNDFFRTDIEPVINDEGLQRWGWREKAVQLQGCSSRGLAHRYGKWILDVEQNETETVDFTASWDSTDVRPGNIIAIADPAKAQVRIGGRLKAAEPGKLWLDFPFKPENGATYQIYVTLPDGEVKLVSIERFTNEIFDKGESLGYDRVVLKDSLDELPLVNSMWVMRGTDIQPRLYRVITIKEDKKNLFKITALFHDVNKYARVENMTSLQPVSYSRPKNESLPPENLQVREVSYLMNGQAKSSLTLSWSNPTDYLTKEYEVGVLSPQSGYNTIGTTSNNSIDISDLSDGEYTFYVYAISYSSVRSQPASLVYEVAGWNVSSLATVSDLKLVGGDSATTFSGVDVAISWVNNFPASTNALSEDATPSNTRSPFYAYNTVKIYNADTDALLRTERVYVPGFTYTFDMNKADGKSAGIGASRHLRFEVTVTDTLSRETNGVLLTVTNPVPAAFIPDVIPRGSLLLISWITPEEADVQGSLIWVSQTPNFDPETTSPVFEGTGSFMTFSGVAGLTYYIRAAAYDSFGRTGLNIAPAISVATLEDIDTEAPAKPMGLTATSVIGTDGYAKTSLSWTANSESDLQGYIVFVKAGSENYVQEYAPSNGFDLKSLPGVVLKLKVVAYDTSNNRSDASDELTLTAAVDAEPPKAPTGLTASAGVDAIWLKWSPNTEADLDHYEVWENSTNNSATAALLGTTPATTLARTGLPLQAEKFYWVKAVDSSRNASEFSSVASATTGSLPSPNVFALQDALFTPNSGQANRLTWTAGTVVYGAPGSSPTSKAISSGQADWTAGTTYIFYKEGDASLTASTAISAAYGSGCHLVGIYKGGTNYQSVEGKTLVDGSTILAGTVGSQQLVTNAAVITGTAQIADAVVSSAKIISLDAVKLTAGSTITGSVLVAGTALSTIQAQAANPAATVNSGSTKIDPGKIVISGASTLADWRGTSDTTTINGGKIEAQSLKVSAILASTISGSNLVLDPYLQDASYWGPDPYVSLITSADAQVSAMGVLGAVKFDVGARSAAIPNSRFHCWIARGIPLAPNTWYRVRYRVKNVNCNRTLACAMNDTPVVAGSQHIVADPNNAAFMTSTGDILETTFKTGATQPLARIVPYVDVGAGGSGYWLITAFEIVTMSETTSIVDGAITTYKIAFNSIIGDRIQANTITTTHLQAGTVTADKMAIGVGGNLLANSDFQAGLTNWGVDWTNAGSAFTWLIRKENWGVQPYGSLELRINNNVVGNVGGVAPVNPGGDRKFWSCAPGQWMELSCYYLGHRSAGIELWMGFLNAAGDTINYQNVTRPAAQNTDPNYSLAGYQRAFAKIQAPAGANRCFPFIRNAGPLSGETDAYVWITNVYFGYATANQSEPTPWSSGAVTIISGGNIATSAVTADKISVTNLSAISANLGSITGGSININNRFIVASDGTTTIQSGTSGARVVMTNSLIRVYDGNNVERVRLGVW